MDRRTFLLSIGAFTGSAVPVAGHRVPWRDAFRAAWQPRGERDFRYLGLDPAYVYSRPCFTGDGDRVVYMRAPATANPIAALNSDASPWALWTVGRDGRDPAPFFERRDLGATRPDRCPATGRIALTGVRGDRAELWLVDADGRNATHVPVGDPPRARVYYPSWYPSGDAIAVTDYATHEVLRVDLTTGHAAAVTDPAVVWAGMCSVSPDSASGHPIAFAGQRPGGSYDARDNRIWLASGGEAPTMLDPDPGRTPAWSPSGRRLAFSSERGRAAPAFTLHPRSLPGGTSAIFLRETAGPDRAARPPVGVGPYDVSAIHPKWSPDGATLVCMAQDLAGERRGLALIDLGERG